jgi:uncharacterized damage-inducible protein DinB
MNTKALIEQYTTYNLWANQKMTDWLLSGDPTLREVESKSSFPTINKTISHIWVAEHVWRCRIEQLQWANLQTHHDGITTSQITEDLLLASQWYIHKINEVSESDLDKIISYKLLSGEVGESRLVNIFHHVMNHSTYHRGQLVTMGRELGFTDPPKTDFIQFCRDKSIK